MAVAIPEETLQQIGVTLYNRFLACGSDAAIPAVSLPAWSALTPAQQQVWINTALASSGAIVTLLADAVVKELL